jgi:hypothetical protein
MKLRELNFLTVVHGTEDSGFIRYTGVSIPKAIKAYKELLKHNEPAVFWVTYTNRDNGYSYTSTLQNWNRKVTKKQRITI